MKDAKGDNHYSVDPFPDDEIDANDILPAGHERGESTMTDLGRGMRIAGLKAIDHWKLASVNMLAFKGNHKLAIICNIAAHGWWSLLSFHDQVAIADYFKCERANVNKIVKLAQKRLKLPPTLGQRSDAGCDKMQSSRLSQQTKNKKNEP